MSIGSDAEERELNERRLSLDREETARKNDTRGPVIFKVDSVFREVNPSHFAPSVISLGLFRRRAWNSFDDCTTKKRESLKLDVAIKFLADVKKQRSGGWREVRKRIVEEPIEMKNLYDGISSHFPSSHFDGDVSEFIRSALALDAIFVTSFFIHFCPRNHAALNPLKFLSSKLEQSSQLFSRESDKFLQELVCDIFKLENQIPLVLIRKTIKVILESFQDSQLQLREYSEEQIFEKICRRAVMVGFECFPHFLVCDPVKFRECHHLLHCLAHVIWEEARSESARDKLPLKPGTSFPLRKCILDTQDYVATRLGTSITFRRIVTSKTFKRRFTTSATFRKRLTTSKTFKRYVKKRHSDNNEDSELPQSFDYLIVEHQGLVTATELSKSGITLEVHDELFPKLVTGRFVWWRATLFLPGIQSVKEHAEQYWKNVLAFEERFLLNDSDKSFISYLTFMNDLINTEKDVLLLCTGRNPVIRASQLGDHQQVADLFNFATKHHNFTMGDTWRSLEDDIMWYYNWSHRVRLVEFMDTYFSRPWLLLSLTAAVLLLIFSFLSTLYNILDYYLK